jgi:heptosyltransferase-2/heptosyltransferase-3
MSGEGHSQFSILNSTLRRYIRLLFLYVLALLARPFARRPPAQIHSILFVKPDHLGDVLLATPALHALRHHFPQSRVVALVGPWSEVVLRRNPDVDRLLICPFPGFERVAKDAGSQRSFARWLWSLFRPYLTLLRYAQLLRAVRYDLAIIARDDHWWGAALALLAGIPRRIGFAVPECRPFLTDALPWDPRAHVSTQALALVATAAASRTEPQAPLQGNTAKHPLARFDPSPTDLDWADAWLQAQGLDANDQLVVLHPGTAGPSKLWFPERWAQVAEALMSLGVRLVLTGGPDEVALVEDIVGRMPQRPPTLAGQTSFGQLAALLRRAALVLGVDSGPLHLAAAQGVATVHLYGPGDAERFGPWGASERHVVLRAERWCSPCGVFEACPRGLARPACMEQFTSERVIAAAQRLLEGNRGEQRLSIR